MIKFPETLVIGIGNKYRRDDAVGLWLAKRLKEKAAHCKVAESSGELTELMELWQGFSRVVAVDSTASGAKAGTIFRFDARQQTLPAETFHYSTHAVSLPEAIELARTLGQLPERVVVYGIEGKNFTAGEGLSAEVRKAAEEVTEKILREIERDLLPSS